MVATLAVLHGGADFSWTRWELHPSILVGCGLLLLGYTALIGPLRRRYGWGPPVADSKVLCFLSAIALIFLSLNGPLHDLSDNFLFSAHMIQHMLIMLIMPPLLLLGLPSWILTPLLRRRPVYVTARVITNPLIAFGIYNAVFAGWHFPQFYNWALVNHDVHIVQHLMFMAAATIMWWPVVNPAPELKRLNTPVRLLYLFALGIPMSIVSAIITLNDRVMYPFYNEAPRVFPLLSPLDDQQLGGLIMWVPGAIIFWGAITIIFLRWARREERDEWRERDLIAAAPSHGRTR